MLIHHQHAARLQHSTRLRKQESVLITWYVVEDRPMSKAKTIRVRVTWRGKENQREVTLDTVLSQ
jgi:hypothetical protein